ncbi:MAG TPA: zinc ribbon domain-containing protein [Chloroflexi bacterium]|nr:zinc ribbon domain-containing protein [Chloroflexota bacterium]
MPLYAFACADCGHAFEAFASIEKKERGWKPSCPKCGNGKVRQSYEATWIGRSSTPRSRGNCCGAR